MNRILRVIGAAGIAFLFIASIQDVRGKRVFAAFTVLEDPETGEIVEELYPVCIFEDGEYKEALVGLGWEHALQKHLSEKETLDRSILNHVTNFSVYIDKGQSKQIHIDELAIARYYHCSHIVVGRSAVRRVVNRTSIDATTPSEQYWGMYGIPNSNGSMKKVEFNYLVRQFAALGSNGPCSWQPIQPLAFVSDSLQLERMMQLVKEDYVKAGLDSQYIDSIQVVVSQPYDLDRNGTVEYLFITEAPWRTFTIGGWDRWTRLVWLQIVNGQVTMINIEPMKMGARKWFWALTDQPVYLTDISGDGVPELVLKSVGYEGSGFSVYEFRQGKFIRVFNGAVAGC